MKHTFLYISLFFITLFCNAQNAEQWTFVEYPDMEKVAKWDENIRYIFTPSVDIKERNEVIKKTKEYINDNLKIIGESELKDSIEIIFVDDKKEMYEYTALHVSGTVFVSEKNLVFCVYGDRMPLKHELMHVISMLKWEPHNITWLSEGLATYSDPDFECNDYSLEERYVAFLQKDKLVPMDTLMSNFHQDILLAKDFDNNKNRIRYNQSAYLVQYMIDNYSIGKVKELWKGGMDKFEKIFGLKIEDMLIRIENKLNEKYPHPIDFDWDKFEQPCY